MLCHSPASPERRGGGKGAGWCTRHQPQRDKGGMLCHSLASLLEGVKEVRSEVLSLFIPTSRELVGSRTIDYNSMLNRTVKEVRSEVLSLFIPVYPDKSGTSRELVGSRTLWETFVEMKNHLRLDVYVSYFEHPPSP